MNCLNSCESSYWHFISPLVLRTVYGPLRTGGTRPGVYAGLSGVRAPFDGASRYRGFGPASNGCQSLIQRRPTTSDLREVQEPGHGRRKCRGERLP